jgi:hypothetical protein
MSQTVIQKEFPGATAKGWAEFRLIPRVETYPAVVSFVQTPPGKFLLLILFYLDLCFFLRDWGSALGLAFVIGLMTFMPEYRRISLAVAPLIFVALQTTHEPLLLVETLSVVVLGMLLYWCAMQWPKSRFGRRPLVFLLTGFSALIVLACATTQHSRSYLVLWTLVGVVATYVWFIAYAVTDKSSKPASDATLELASLRPLWGSSNVPSPKGAAYLRRIEAKTPEQLAVVQLKGLKLLMWAILLQVFQVLWFKLFHDYLRIPMPDQALAMSVRGTPVAWHLRWRSQILVYFELILSVSIFGHRFIACCRIGWLQCFTQYLSPTVFDNPHRILQSLLLLFQRITSRFLLLSGFSPLLEGVSPVQNDFCNVRGCIFR